MDIHFEGVFFLSCSSVWHCFIIILYHTSHLYLQKTHNGGFGLSPCSFKALSFFKLTEFQTLALALEQLYTEDFSCISQDINDTVYKVVLWFECPHQNSC